MGAARMRTGDLVTSRLDPAMRLSPKTREAIAQAAADTFPPGTIVRVFGSRLHDDARGGDIDLLVEPPESLAADDLVERRSRFITRLYRSLGEQRIDVLVATQGDSDERPIVDAARRVGQLLTEVRPS